MRIFLAKEIVEILLKFWIQELIKVLNLGSLEPVKWMNKCVKDRFYFCNSLPWYSMVSKAFYLIKKPRCFRLQSLPRHPNTCASVVADALCFDL